MLRQDNQEIFDDFCAAVESTEQRQLRLAQLEQQQAKESKAMPRQVDLDNMEWWIANHTCFTAIQLAQDKDLRDSLEVCITDIVSEVPEHNWYSSDGFRKFLQQLSARTLLAHFRYYLAHSSTSSARWWIILYIQHLELKSEYI